MSDPMETALDAVGVMKPEPTPGPWHFQCEGWGFGTLEDKDGRTIFLVAFPDPKDGISHAETIENARLIAAASDLLAIVRDLVAEIEGGNLEPSSELLARANAALVQGKGGAE